MLLGSLTAAAHNDSILLNTSLGENSREHTPPPFARVNRPWEHHQQFPQYTKLRQLVQKRNKMSGGGGLAAGAKTGRDKNQGGKLVKAAGDMPNSFTI